MQLQGSQDFYLAIKILILCHSGLHRKRQWQLHYDAPFETPDRQVVLIAPRQYITAATTPSGAYAEPEVASCRELLALRSRSDPSIHPPFRRKIMELVHQGSTLGPRCLSN